MFKNSLSLFFLLGTIVFSLSWLKSSNRTPWLFRFFPLPFWCYFIPMVLTTVGVTPEKSVLYDLFSRYLLPASLALLLIGTDLPAILSLGAKALAVMAVGALGIIVGGPTVFFLFRSFLPPEAWKGIGALSGSWIGGSSNMLALKEILGTPDPVFAPVVITDVVVAYSWMGLLIALAAFQKTFDHWVKAEDFFKTPLSFSQNTSNKIEMRWIPLLVLFGFLAGFVCSWMGQRLPRMGVFTPTAWSLILVTTLSLAFSFSPLRKLESLGASALGSMALLLLLTSLGAKASLVSIVKAPVFILAGIAWVSIHGFFLLAAGKIFRVPLAILATASQANVGGPISTPMVAAVYEKSLVPVGVLMAILGNVLGTYGGLLCAYLCQKVSSF